MISSNFYTNLFNHIYITKNVAKIHNVLNAIDRLPGIPVHYITDKQEIPEKHLNSRTLFITSPRGNTVGRCPGTRGHLCCNYLTIDLYVGCLIGCSYCILQDYLNFSPITVYADTKTVIEKVKSLANINHDRVIRIGTGEVGDSLLFDPLFELSPLLIEEFSKYKNIFFELKTKTNFIDHLLNIEKKGNTVIGFSLNPQDIADSEEGIAAPVKERLKAAYRATDSGYLVSFHFDPIIFYNGWEKKYKELIDSIKIAYGIPKERIAWISMGTFRYTPELKDISKSKMLFLEEFIPSKDKKYRYIQKIRSGMYRTIKERIESNFPSVPIYMCMESVSVWENVFGNNPYEIEDLRDIFKPVKGV